MLRNYAPTIRKVGCMYVDLIYYFKVFREYLNFMVYVSDIKGIELRWVYNFACSV